MRFWLEELEEKAAAIKFIDLYRIGEDAITIHTKSVIQEISVKLSVLYKFAELSDKLVYCETGINIGTLMDIYYDSQTGEIKFYELSDSFFYRFGMWKKNDAIAFSTNCRYR